MPEGFVLKEITIIGGYLVFEGVYFKGDSRIWYRTSRGYEKISGVYTEYEENKSFFCMGSSVLTHGKDGKISLATWLQDGNSFSLYFDTPVEFETIFDIMRNMKVEGDNE